MNWIKKACFISIGWLLGLILVLIFFEIALRVIYGGGLNDARFSGGNKIPSQVASELGLPVSFEYDYDIRTIYKAKENIVKYTRDEFGLRNPCGKPGNIDILTIGGSTTNQRYVKDESTYQAVIERLALDNDGKEICVVNAGIEGHSTYGHIRAFEEWFPLLPDLSPKYVLLYVGINDLDFNRNYGRILGSQKRLKALIRRTYLAHKTRPFFRYLRGEIEEINPRESVEKYYDDKYVVTDLPDDTVAKVKIHADAFRMRFQTLLNHVDAMGAKPICVTQPHRFTKTIDGETRGLARTYFAFDGLSADYSIREVNKIMQELCGDDNIIDMYSVEYEEEKMFYDAFHTTDIGSEFLGKKMYEAMKEKGMLEGF